MKTSFSIPGLWLLASLALLPTGSALAQAQITFTSAYANWHSPTDNTPGSQPGDPVITNGVPTSSISWGTSSGPQSGYDVTITIPDPQQFPVATFSHRNFPVSDPSLTSVQLDFVLDFEVDGAQTGPLTFTFTFTHEETPNNQNPCPYPTPPGEGCTDRVTFIDMPDPTTFTVGGVTYTLGLSFLDDDGNPVGEFITLEGGTVNTANLDGQFVLVPPVLEVTKSGPPTMIVGQPGVFAIDVRNTGPNDAWNTTVRGALPDGATGGMCDYTPQVLGAQVFAADGVSSIPGKGPLQEGTDYTFSYAAAPTCELTLAMLTPAAAIDTDQRLIITYRTQLDDDSQGGIALTNVAGAIEWFDDLSSNPNRTTYTRTLTDGTPGVLDHEDAYTVLTFAPVLQFEKTVVNVTTGKDPATVATAGDTLRYRLRVENLSDTPLDNFRFVDELDHLNAAAMFEAGTLNVITVPAGADSSATDPNGGAAGSGLLDIGGLSLAGLGDSALIEFEVDLVPAIADGTLVYNQSELRSGTVPIALSDDPYVNGAADPNVAGDEDPTRILIESPPSFRIEKISTYLGASPNVLLAGERLRYTITVQNTGSADAAGVELVDQLPASTTYVPGSTTLNGVAIPDSGTGGLPLVDGIPINAPQDPTPGVMNGGVADNTATITFDVTVYPDVPDGTVISNQAFVSALGYGIADQPSDDPRTPLVDDPTRDIVGNLPLLFATKSAALQVDLGSPGIVDPGDVLRYTIQIYNNGSIPATAVRLGDAVPADTTYVADTLTLNGLPVGQPDGGVSPLIASIPVSSADLTPPLPAAGEGVLTAGESATVQFDLQVNAGTPTGTLITNQATVYSTEVPNLLTDGDGNPATGPEPTVVVVGDAQQLTITKTVAVVNGGPALAGSTLQYVVTVTNVGAVPALYVLITDDLDVPFPGYLSYVDQSATLNGVMNGVTFTGTMLTADYFSEYGALNPGQTAVLRFQAVINPTLANGTPITNTAHVAWNDPTQYAMATVSIDVGAIVGFGMLSGTVWHDADFDDTPDATERLLQGWTVELLLNGQPTRSTTTAADGTFLLAGVVPNYLTQDLYSLRFSAPGAGSRTAALGRTDSDFTDYLQRIDDIVVTPGSNLLALNLPIDPNGVVYDSVSRSPIAGATVTLLDAGGINAVPASCFDDAVQQDQVTTSSGYFKFDINFSQPGCPDGGNYLIRVTPPGSSYVQGPSELIPPTSDRGTLPFNVPACPGSANDAIIGTSQHCEVQVSEFAPTVAVPARSAGTRYHSYLTLDGSQPPGSGQLFNNHIPLDPVLTGAVSVTKTTPMLNVTRGQLVPYVITVSNSFGIALQDINVVDRFPAGFHYVEGSARFDDVPNEPAIADRVLTWSNLSLTSEGRHEIKLLLAAGSGVTEGEFVNRAQAVNGLTGGILSEEAAATVRIVPDPTFDCTDVTGKVFNDNNRNGYQDGDEAGLAGVRLVTASGLAAVTDTHGRYHITCAITPNESRGSNFVLKLDDRTLPSGFRPSTRPVEVQRATRGKALRINFGASIHRVVAIDIADAAFEPGNIALRHQWQPRIGLLVSELQKGPAVLRLSYVADTEDESLVDARLESIKRQVMEAWNDLNCCYELVVESDVHWRLGGPPEKAKVADRRTP